MAAAKPASPGQQAEARPATRLIGGSFAVDPARPLPGAGGGLPAFVAIDRNSGRTGLMAVQSRPGAPARAQVLGQLLADPPAGVLAPLAHGPAAGTAGDAWFVVCQAPPGPPLWAASAGPLRPWSESDVLDGVLRPAALALEQLQEHRVTHRAIRPENLFRGGSRDPVVLGCAWAAPPASLQPALYEPPYVSICLPGGRGEGSIADDVYALGVVLLVLTLGRLPMAGLDEAAIIRRKLEMGSYAALVAEERLPPAIGDLVRGMLAEDPEHRPPPALLADPAAARARRVAARPPRRAQRQFDIAGQPVWTARTLAHAMVDSPAQAVLQLRGGGADRWIRRNLGDSLLATKLEEVVRLRSADTGADERADAMLAMRAVAVLDPLAPLCWRGMALWPDGIGPALAALPAGDADDTTAVLEQLVAGEVASAWAAMRPERCDVTLVRLEAHQNRLLLGQRGWGGGLARLRYALNPLLACRSPLLEGQLVTRLADLLPALEGAAANPERRRQAPVDREIAAFLAARNEYRADTDLVTLAEAKLPAETALAQLRLLAGLQGRQGGQVVPNLGAWLGEQLQPALTLWRNRARRRRLEGELKELATAGQLPAVLSTLTDPTARAEDTREMQAAIAAVERIDAQLTAIAGGGARRSERARRIGQEAIAGLGALALTVALVLELLF